jgi:hypothetical protein
VHSLEEALCLAQTDLLEANERLKETTASRAGPVKDEQRRNVRDAICHCNVFSHRQVPSKG